MTINTSRIISLLRPGLDMVFGAEYNRYPQQWRELYTTRSSDKNYELQTEMKYLPTAAYKAEGAPIQFADMAQQAVTTFYHRSYAVGYVITREAILDNLYKDAFPEQANSLRNSLHEAKELQAAALFNNAFDAAYPLADQQPLCSTSHPIVGGTVSNTLGIQQLNETSLENMLILIRKFRDAAGLRIDAGADKLVVPTELEFQADRLLSSKYRTGTANNDINAIYNMKALPGGYTVNRYFSNPGSFFILTNLNQYLTHYEREALKADMFPDIMTTNINVTAYERYSFGCSNFRSVAGAQGA